MITGSCLCNTVRWQIDGPLGRMTHCHCSMCRKAHGAAFGTYIRTPTEAFGWLAGQSAIVHYESSPGFERGFCATCGSVVPVDHGNGRVSMPAGCLNEDPKVRPDAHIFATQKAPWYSISDELAQFDSYPDPGDGPNITRVVEGKAKNGILRGSCLCGDIAFEVRGPIKFVHNCHCSRCRKARGAAHATNGFTALDHTVFTRGEDKLVTYKLEDARFFTHVFCARCGSGMPRHDSERNIAVFPLGALDDDPGIGAQDHIFVESMAPWHTITDDLPQFDEGPS